MSSPEPDPRLIQAAEKCGHPVDALRLAVECLSYLQTNQYAQDGHLTAADFCRTFLETVMDIHREETMATLKTWNIERSEDLGRIVYALIDVGLVKPNKDDRQEDFDDLFHLQRQFFSWNNETEAERLAREEHELRKNFRLMNFLGGILAIACFAGVPWTASPAPLIIFGLAAIFVPSLLFRFVMHGYRKARAE